jgi:predicted HAD superfamily Cof-like phosphohydrolase
MTAGPYHQTPVEEFHRAFGVGVELSPVVPPAEVRLLRLNLILEELLELAQASGFELRARLDEDREATFAFHREHAFPPSILDAADALADLRYVIDGASLVWGIPLERCLAEVHRSNMSKLGADGKPLLREDGKILKGPNYSPPNLTAVLWPEGDVK